MKTMLAIVLVVATPGALAAGTSNFPAAGYEAGGHTLSFDGKGRFQLTNDSDKKVLVDGAYAVKGGEISLTDRSGPYACTGDKAAGTYRWEVVDEGLRLTKVTDPCDDRSGDLTAAVWSKK